MSHNDFFRSYNIVYPHIVRVLRNLLQDLNGMQSSANRNVLFHEPHFSENTRLDLAVAFTLANPGPISSTATEPTTRTSGEVPCPDTSSPRLSAPLIEEAYLSFPL